MWRMSAQVSVLTVIVKDSDRTMRKKFLLYDVYEISANDPVIGRCIAETIDGFKGTPEKVTIRISFDLS